MRGEPPESLVDLLERLRLATRAEVRRVAPRVRRLAGELPDFESVWVDALGQARVLTPLQAAQINAGLGDALVCGPYTISRRLASPLYAECFAAQHIETGRTVRLYRVEHPQVAAAAAAGQLSRLVEQLAPLRGPAACVVEDAGLAGDGVWAACPAVEGTQAADWMAQNGRFPPHVVLHIAREMLARLADLELLGAVHGDVGAAGLVIRTSGHVVLPMPGLRGIVRPSEGYGYDDLPPAAYDYLAPERIAEGSAPTVASDLYACGCLWWHLLAGRPPLAGGSSLTKLKAVHAANLIDVRQLAPEAPEALARAIEACLAHDPAERPQSSCDVLEGLGPAARGGDAVLSRCLAGQAWLWQPTGTARHAGRRRRKRTLAATGAAVMACVVAAGLWLARHEDPATPNRAIVAVSEAGPQDVVETRREQPSADRNATASSPRHVDSQVRPASAVEPLADDGPRDLVLPSGKKVGSSALRLEPGCRVRGEPGQRPLVSLSGEGLLVQCEDVSFEGIDFVWEVPEPQSGARGPAPAMIRVAAQSLEMRGCSFSTVGGAAPIAIAWRGSADAPPGYDGQLVFVDCVFRGVEAVVDGRGATGLTVELTNTLCVAAGPIVRLHACPKRDQTIAISLAHTTTRGDCAVLECRYRRLEPEPGRISITVVDSALVTNPQGGLLIFAGPQRPEPLLRSTSWNGQGSLVTPETAVALWRGPGGRQEALAEDELEVAGLVRSDVEFWGSAAGPPADSRITRWQVPLRSAEPPGADSNLLYLPKE